MGHDKPLASLLKKGKTDEDQTHPEMMQTIQETRCPTKAIGRPVRMRSTPRIPNAGSMTVCSGSSSVWTGGAAVPLLVVVGVGVASVGAAKVEVSVAVTLYTEAFEGTP